MTLKNKTKKIQKHTKRKENKKKEMEITYINIRNTNL